MHGSYVYLMLLLQLQEVDLLVAPSDGDLEGSINVAGRHKRQAAVLIHDDTEMWVLELITACRIIHKCTREHNYMVHASAGAGC